MGRPKILEIKAVTDSRQGVRGLKQLETSADRTQRRVSKAGRIGAAALLALGAAGIHAAKAAAADEASQTTLASAMRKNAGATDKSIASTEKWIDRTARAKGVADDQLRPALATLVRATGSASKAQKSLSLAMDISAATGKPLATVSAALAKGYSGNTVALGRLVPGIDKATIKSGNMAKITGVLAKKVGGDAARAAATNEGKLRRMSVATGELEEQLGAVLLPALGTLVDVLGTTATFLQNNSKAVLIVAAVLGGLAVTVVTINAAYRAYQATLLAVETIKKLSVITTAAQTAAQYALGTAWLAGRLAAIGFAFGIRLINAAMKANPLGLLITGITLVIGLLVLAYKRSSTFRSIVQAAGRGASAAMGWIIDKTKSVVQWLGKLGPAASKGKDIAVKAFKLYTLPIRTVIDLIKKLIGWLGRIKFPKVPKAFKKLGGLFGGGGAPKTPPDAPGGSASAWGRGGPGGGGFSIPVGGGRGGYGNTYIVVNGALDPVAVGDQIDTILTRRARRRGLKP
ncbi:hypothetical protein [Aeromicrobium sp. 9AM]|uniref:hypothetical protein n=1 Tax=Aeromicrobium sp. 9AM TaxID=2653126 RepID=UPI0012F38DE1|nr:hypothetical protein [Aeromicrobium sp. 9AM]VXC21313.1 membrane hypothetical protein [Aeromicrobium sp. 9AM]